MEDRIEAAVCRAARGLGHKNLGHTLLPGPQNDRAWLEAQVAKGLTKGQMAKAADCSETTISKQLKRHGMEMPRNAKKPLGKWHDVEWLRKRRVVEHMSVEDMALLAGCSTQTIKTSLRKAGIVVPQNRRGSAPRVQQVAAKVGRPKNRRVPRFWQRKAEPVEPCDGLACGPDVDCIAIKCKRWRG